MREFLDFRVVRSDVDDALDHLDHSDVATALEFWRFSTEGGCAPMALGGATRDGGATQQVT